MVAYLRSCYSTTAWCYNADGTLSSFDIVYSWARDDALPVAQHHRYDSSNWTRGIAYPDKVGEVIANPRVWQNGQRPLGLTGTVPCGTDWLTAPTRTATPEPDNAYGQPLCCPLPAECQQRSTLTPPQIRMGDVGSFVNLVNLGGTKWGDHALGPGQRFGLRQFGTCHGSPAALGVLWGGAPLYALASTAVCDYCPAPYTLGRWVFPPSDPFNPGTVFWLKTH